MQQFEERITQVDSPAEKINLMSNLAWQLRIRDPEKAYSLGIKSLELAQTLDLTEQPYPQGLASSLVVLSFLDGEAGKMDTAMSRSLDALSCI